MKEVMITPDGMKLTAQYRVVYQTRNMENDGENATLNILKKHNGMISPVTLFDTYYEAKAELEKLIKRSPPMEKIKEIIRETGVEVSELVEKYASKEIVHWEIQKQWRSDWDTIDKA